MGRIQPTAIRTDSVAEIRDAEQMKMILVMLRLIPRYQSPNLVTNLKLLGETRMVYYNAKCSDQRKYKMRLVQVNSNWTPTISLCASTMMCATMCVAH